MTWLDYDNVVKWRWGVPTWRLRSNLIAGGIRAVLVYRLLC